MATTSNKRTAKSRRSKPERVEPERVSERKYEEIYEVIRGIPRGKVATYGQVAALAGRPGAARVVGVALRAASSDLKLPWQRVVGKKSRGQGKISIPNAAGKSAQEALLRSEGVCFTPSGGIRLEEFGWLPIHSL